MKQWKVKVGRRWRTVHADYYKIESGALVFRNTSRDGQYPDTMAVFAAGAWSELRGQPYERG